MPNATICAMQGREIFDSRGNPTLEVDVLLGDGTWGRAAVPSGVSTGEHEAVELRDGGKRLGGKGVLQAVHHVNETIAEALKGHSPFDQAAVDQVMIDLDGTPNKSRLGANTILGVSMAVCRAAAQSQRMPLYRYLGGVDSELPLPFFNIINGGKHAKTGIAIQEFMITPVGAVHFREAMERVVETYHMLGSLLADRGLATSVGDEGGFAPQLDSSEEAVQLMIEAIQQAGYEPGKDIAIALDPAASEFYRDGLYHFEGNQWTGSQMSNYYEQLINKYPVISIEDGMSEKDETGWQAMTQRLGQRVQLVGDDIFVTNPAIFREGIRKRIGNSILIKPNQIGTVSQSMEAIKLARQAGYTTMISHRSGDTEDTFIADFATGMSAGQIKTGAVARTEGVAKYNQFLRIEEELSKYARLASFVYPGQ